MWSKWLTEDQRQFLADKLMDTANWAIGGLGFGQLISQSMKPLELLLGLLIYFWILSITLQLKKK